MALPLTFIGVDLAWVPKNRTGLVAAIDGLVVDSTTAVTDEQICEWIAPYTTRGPVLVAVDAPVIVSNPPRTSRPCDRKISMAFGASHAGAHSANPGIPSFIGGVRADRLAQRLGLSLDPFFLPGEKVSRMIEVYPHPAMVSLFGLAFTLKYKAKRGRTVDGRRQAFTTLVQRLESLTTGDPPLVTAAAPRWAKLGGDVADARTDRDLDLVEDELDAYMCAYIALYYWTHGPNRCRVVGDLETGYIVTPVTPPIGLLLDQLVLRPVRAPARVAYIPRPAGVPQAVDPPRTTHVPSVVSALCGCGCGQFVRRRYLPGHDARHKEALIREALARHAEAEVSLAQLGWTKFLDSRRTLSERPG